MKKLFRFSIIMSITAFVFLAPFESNSQQFKAGVDLMSRYNWRGKDFGASPSIQPLLEFSYSNFAIGTWAAITTNGNNYHEHDIYLSYTPIEILTISATDYFFPNETAASNHYFEYGKNKTGHIMEGTLKFNGTASLPVTAAINYNFHGADTANSSYLELGYYSSLKDTKFDIFMGFALGKGIYGDSFGVVNLGLTVKRDIKVTETFTLPVLCRFITNPQLQNTHLIFGLSL